MRNSLRFLAPSQGRYTLGLFQGRRPLFGADVLWPLALFLMAASISACAAQRPEHADQFRARYGLEVPERYAFSLCFGHGCKHSAAVWLNDAQWAEVRMIFIDFSTDMPTDVATSAREERVRIARAIALLESIAGEQAGTLLDKARTGFPLENRYQLDCVDEALNTTAYLAMMKQDGLLRFHDLRGPATRGFLFRGWPHTTAAIFEPGSGRPYAVDSWFFDNGKAPVILPLSQWQDGWQPQETKNRASFY